MAGAFQLLRSNDLICSRIVRDYLMGVHAPMTDLSAWNADANRLPTTCIRSICVNCSSNTIPSKAATKPTGKATLYLTVHGIRIVGTDAWSWDPPLMSQMKKIEETGGYSLFWEGHKARAETIYCQLEKLGNLASLPATGFDVICFPVNIKAASAGWCRPVAIIES